MSSYTWSPIEGDGGGGGGGGVDAIGSIDSQTASANGGVIAGTTLYFQSASATRPGLVNNTTQTFAGNKTFTGTVAASNLSGTNTGDVTLGTASGLSIVGQALSLGLASAGVTGALSGTDWSTFNGKQNALTLGDLTEATSSVLTITGGTGAIIGSGLGIQVKLAGAGQSGYLSSTDWNTFNNKQAAGTYVTSLTVASSNGFAGSFTAGATPALTLSTSVTGILKGNGTSISAAIAADFPTLNQNTTGTASNVTGTVAIANGGTGQTSAANALNALLPTQTGNSGKFLTTNATAGSWAFPMAIGNTISSATAGSVLFAGAAGVLAQDNANFFFDDAANILGIGTAAPTVASGNGLVINGGAGQARIALKTTASGDASTDGFQIGLNGTAAVIQNRENGAIGIETNGTQRMILTNSTDVVFGTLTAAPTAGEDGISVWTAGQAILRLSRSGTSGTHLQVQNNNGVVGSISTSGSTTAFNTSSDYRLKESVQPMVGALERIGQLKPVTYLWKVDGSVGEGFIAHELQAVIPSAVTGAKDAVDADGNPSYQGVDQSKVVATLVAAIQELKAELDAVKAQLAAETDEVK